MSRKNQQILVFGFGFVLAVVLSVAALFIWFKVNQVNPFRMGEAIVQPIVNAISTHPVVIVKGSIPAGALITADFLEQQERAVTDIPLTAVLDISDAVGRYAALDLDGKVILTTGMMSENSIAYLGTDRMCDYEIPGYLVNYVVEPGMMLDVQLVRSSGQTFTVLAKKGVRMKAENRVVLAVSFPEMDLVNRAFAEQAAGLGRIQLVTYMDSTQEASIVNYTPDPSLPLAALPAVPTDQNSAPSSGLVAPGTPTTAGTGTPAATNSTTPGSPAAPSASVAPVPPPPTTTVNPSGTDADSKGGSR